ncbi:hypothetical protein CC78DRAFT_319658 [Lojkania enalia]|uniref:Uncharacterized protein n=1 Tax=Lojkania enalia TaxID=147567 RepID=A0A9P4K3N7_9PLEO|nr:hypothetical protein CC78DRAFT_319658 [Didymosphaeria enalia]
MLRGVWGIFQTCMCVPALNITLAAACMLLQSLDQTIMWLCWLEEFQFHAWLIINPFLELDRCEQRLEGFTFDLTRKG